ncbi:MAG: hypothetical protein ABI353_04350 [Isosphaeraceae bacterium]
MEPHHLRAPAVDGAVLSSPPLSDVGSQLVENQNRLAAWDYDFQGRRAGWLRMQARNQAITHAKAELERFGLALPSLADPAAPWIATGHQPELFHPGVWIKNFAAGELAKVHHAVSLNLIVDNDLPKGASIRVPHCDGDALRSVPVEFDEWDGDIPYEDWAVSDEAKFANFGQRVAETLGTLVPDPLINEFWPGALQAAEVTDRVGLRLTAARRGLEASWGVSNWEVPLGKVCESEAFLWFASHLLAHLPRFQGVHNGSLARYRALYGIRSRNHPVASLRQEGPWLEAPFWVWRAGQPRRRPLMARQLAKTMQLRIGGEDEPFAEIPLGPDREACCAVEQLHALPGRRIRLRTRALTTTLFARLLLADVFLHGIGGAKYDELGDEIAREFFGLKPPSYQTLSMTAWLGLEPAPATPDQFHDVEHQLRDLRFNPERFLTDAVVGDWSSVVLSKQEAIAGPVETRRQRVSRFFEIRRCNEALQEAVQPVKSRLETERSALLAGLRRNRLVHHREYPFVLHSASRLRETFRRALTDQLGG